MNKYYGKINQIKSHNEFSQIAEEIKFKGFSVVEGIFNKSFINIAKKKLLELNLQQNTHYGEEFLDSIN